MPKRTPSYRKRKGYDQAIVTLADARTKKRRDYWLGPYNTPQSRQLYHRLLAEWEANGHVLPVLEEGQSCGLGQITITEIIHAFWNWAQTNCRSSSEVANIKVAVRLLRSFYGQTSAIDFGPKKLRFLREQMIHGDESAEPPRQAWARTYVNPQIKRIRRMFKWAASHEMLPESVYRQLATVEPLRRGQDNVRETEPVKPVPPPLVAAIHPYVSRQVWALIQLQRLTGARGSELCVLRPMDLVMGDNTGVWTFTPSEHKTSYREKTRVIFFGPKAQEIIRPFLEGRSTEAYLFSPAEAETERRWRRHAARKTPLSCGNRPGTNRRETTKKDLGDNYTAQSYHRAIQYACDKAFLPPEPLAKRENETRKQWQERLTAKQTDDLKAWRKAHRWHPHQLRHLAGTEIRREFGLEAAQIILGHSSAQITDAVYAERDIRKAVAVMAKVG